MHIRLFFLLFFISLTLLPGIARGMSTIQNAVIKPEEQIESSDFFKENGITIWCQTCENRNTIDKNDTLNNELHAIAKTKKCFILTSPCFFNKDNKNEDLIDNSWSLYENENQVTLLVPPGINKPEKLVNLNSFKKTDLESVNNRTCNSKHGAMKLAVYDLLYSKKFNYKYILILSGHGHEVQESYNKYDHKETENSIQCGMKLANLRNIMYGTNYSYPVHLLLYLTCKGSCKGTLNFITNYTYDTTIISGCYGNMPAKFDSNITKNDDLSRFFSTLNSLTKQKNLKKNPKQLFECLENYLQCKTLIQNTPVILWPHEKKFRILAEKAVKDSYNRVTHKSIGNRLIIEQQTMHNLEINENHENTKISLSPITSFNEFTINNLRIPKATSLNTLTDLFALKSHTKPRKMKIDKVLINTNTILKNIIVSIENEKATLEMHI